MGDVTLLCAGRSLTSSSSGRELTCSICVFVMEILALWQSSSYQLGVTDHELGKMHIRSSS